MKTLLFLILSLILSQCNSSPSVTYRGTFYKGEPQLEEAILAKINTERKKEGLSPLRMDERLVQAARQHSQEMEELNYFSHTSPVSENAAFTDRIKQVGVSYGTAGENIAYTSSSSSADQFVSMWMNSEGHRKNILGATYDRTGIGVYAGSKVLATQIFVQYREEKGK